MNNAVFLTLIMLLILPAGYGQSKNRPVRSETWKQSSPDPSFRILMPTEPSTEMPHELKFIDVIGKGERYLSVRGYEKYFVGFRDYAIPIDEDSRMTRSSSFFSPSLPTRKIFSGVHPGTEKTEDVFGMEELFGAGQVRVFYRVFVIDQRLFLLSAFIPFDPASPVKNRRSLANVAKFFNSFRVTNFASLLPPTAYLPPDLGVEVNDRGFSSRALDLEIQLPAGWKTELPGPKDSTVGSLGMGQLREHGEKQRKRFLFARSPGRLSELWLTVEQREFEDSSLTDFVTNRASLIGLKPVKKMIGGREFLLIDLRTKLAGSYTVRRYYTEWQGYILEVGMGFQDAVDIEAMEASLETLRSKGGSRGS